MQTRQLALAWLLTQGKDVVPIPGTRRRSYLEENVAASDVRRDHADLAQLDRLSRRASLPASAIRQGR